MWGKAFNSAWRQAAAKSSSTRARFAAAASGFATVAAAAGHSIVGTEGAAAAEAGYAYVPPARTSENRALAAVEAAKPRVKVAPVPKPRVLFVLGGPGAGKGTQCAKLVSEYGFVHLSAGDLLREERDSGSADGEMIENFIREGKIVPVEVTVNLIRKAMARSGATKFLVDGFPRNFNNLQGWQSVMGETAEVDGVLQYDVPEDVMVARLLERGKTSGRSDDNADTITKRLRTYAESTLPVIEYYAAQGKVSVINGDRAVDAVFEDTRRAVEATVKAEVLAYNQAVLDAISAGDWGAYAALCDASLTCFEPEAAELGLVHGLDFHQHAFEGGARARAKAALSGLPVQWSVSSMQGAEVRLLGPKAAVVTYARHVSPLPAAAAADGAAAAAAAAAAPATISRVAETRVWALQGEEGSSTKQQWRLVHLHRSPMPPLTPQATSA